MSPILLRPIREQLEHDRVIRQLQVRWRRRFDVGINVGREETVSVRSGPRTCFPDLVLTRTAGGRRLHGVIEVETAESVNHLEAMSEWSHFAKAKGSFYLYVPAGFTEIALRLCQVAKVNVTEIWAYYAIDSQAKFSMSYRSPRAKQRIRAASVKTAKKPTSAAKRLKAKKSSAKPAHTRKKKVAAKPSKAKKTRQATGAKPAHTSKKKVAAKPSKAKKARQATGAKPAHTSKKKVAAKPSKVKKARKATGRVSAKRSAPKQLTKKQAVQKPPITARGRRGGKPSATGATKRSSATKRKT